MSKIKKALISVSDKKNLISVLKVLRKFKVQIISSGGTSREIKRLGFKCIEVSKFTGSPEILDGRVKTLHPKIHAGILSKRDNQSNKKDLKKYNYEEIDLVIVNFYPFEEILKKNSSENKILENIDVGGPAMVRAAAKNYKDVTIITSASQYKNLITELNDNNGTTTLKFRKSLSQEAFSETSYLDSLISNYFSKDSKNKFPKKKINTCKSHRTFEIWRKSTPTSCCIFHKTKFKY